MNPKDSYTDRGKQPECSRVRPFSSTLSLADWNPITKETALTGGNKLATYGASKKFAEIALWEWADKHPHVEVTTRMHVSKII
jgi:nucleoside-diphosphate-sugar epimerase